MSSTSQPFDNAPVQPDCVWPSAHAWAVDQMPCPAYCCATDGTILHCNAAALRIWGGRQPQGQGAWHGFAALRDLDGNDIGQDDNPYALATTGAWPAACEFIAIAWDGLPRRIVVHARPVHHPHDTVAGVLCCLTDISEKHHFRKRIREAGKARNEFLQMLAHELRNPLSPIMSIAGCLRHARGDPAIVRMAAVVERQTRQLARFITDLLDASRVGCLRQLPVAPRSCTEEEVLELALDTVQPQVHARHQNLVVDARERDLALCCDPERVAQALSGVLLNASNFSQDGGAFRLHVTRDDVCLVLQVVDSGLGIAADDLQHVFEPFERGSVQSERAPCGAGLGLTIAKGVCEAHGGSIDVRSAGPGQGTTVCMVLPVLARTQGP